MAVHRKQDEEIVSLTDVVAEAVEFLGHEFRLHKIKVTPLPAAVEQLVKVDCIQLQQVVVNLAVNSVQAISASNSTRREVLVRTADEGLVVRCSIEDSGPGIPLDALDRIFQSFFTTKNGGMGMGLLISRIIIEAHGGRRPPTMTAPLVALGGCPSSCPRCSRASADLHPSRDLSIRRLDVFRRAKFDRVHARRWAAAPDADWYAPSGRSRQPVPALCQN